MQTIGKKVVLLGHIYSENSDQTGRMPRLICVFAVRTGHFVGCVTRRLISCLTICLQYCLQLIKKKRKKKTKTKNKQTNKTYEPAHEIMALFILRKLILQTRIRSHPVGLGV